MSTHALPESADFVVIGASPGGLTAALAARSHGLDVVVVEKSQYVGGTSALSFGGMWLPANPLLAEDGHQDSVEDALQYMAATVVDGGPAATPARQEAYVRGGIRALTFLRGQGLKYVRVENYPDYYAENRGGMDWPGRVVNAKAFDARHLGDARDWVQPREPLPMGFIVDSPEVLFDIQMISRTWRARRAAARLAITSAIKRASGFQPLLFGAAHVGQLLYAALRAGVPIHRHTGISSLETDGSRVMAVNVESGEAIHRIVARRGVLLSCGGYAHNKTLREKYGPPGVSNNWSATVPTDTGAGHNAACDIGAATALTDAYYWNAMALFPGGKAGFGGAHPDAVIIHPELHLPHSILVDQAGNRYVNESVNYMELGNSMVEHNATTPAVPSWIIIDRRHRDRYMFSYAMPRMTPKQWLRNGSMHKARTLHELAKATGIDSTTLIATVNRFNALAETGEDTDFGRGSSAFNRMFSDPTAGPNTCLGTIAEPPFYAVALYPGDVGCAGGLLTDEHARVLREDHTPIEGLYACGTTAASALGRQYVGAGISLGQALAFGYIAAEHVAISQPPS